MLFKNGTAKISIEIQQGMLISRTLPAIKYKFVMFFKLIYQSAL